MATTASSTPQIQLPSLLLSPRASPPRDLQASSMQHHQEEQEHQQQQPSPAVFNLNASNTMTPSSTSGGVARSSPRPSSISSNPYAVKDIPPFRPKVSRTSTTTTTTDAPASSSGNSGSNLNTSSRHPNPHPHPSNQRERRTSQASNTSGDSRRNSGNLNNSFRPYPSPGPTTTSPPSSSPTNVHAHFFPSSTTLPSGLSSFIGGGGGTAAPISTRGGAPPGSNAYLGNSITAGHAGHSGGGGGGAGGQEYTYNFAAYQGTGTAMLQGIEAKLAAGSGSNAGLTSSTSTAGVAGGYPVSSSSSSQYQHTQSHPHRASLGGPATNTRSSTSTSTTSSYSSRRQSSHIPVPTTATTTTSSNSNSAASLAALGQATLEQVLDASARITAPHHTGHRPASMITNVVPTMQQPSMLASPPMTVYSPQSSTAGRSDHHFSPQNSGNNNNHIYATPHLSQNTRAPFPAPIITSAHTTSHAQHYQSASSSQQQGGAGAGVPQGRNQNNNNRTRASHQIVPVTTSANAPTQIPTIALHIAQYANTPANNARQKIFFGDYQLLHTLGEGEFGKVKLGVHVKRWGEEVAIKLIKKGNISGDPAKSLKMQREIDVLRGMCHPHIVRLLDVVETDRYIGIVLEYSSGGELFEYILAHKHLRENVACKLFAQLVSGVAYMHAKKVVHRDLKLENLLLDRNRNIIITDFGFANRFDANTGSDLMATSCGSPCYAAPELVLQEGQYVGSAVDVWSCGVILYAMLSGYLPYDDDPNNPDGDNINLLYRYITTTKLSFPDWISSEPRDLLLMMLEPDPMRRCTLRDVMRHPWLSRYMPLFRSTVEELEAQSEAAWQEKAVLLAKQKEAYFRQMSLSASTNSLQAAMARSMSSPGGTDGNSTSQQRHRSAMVQPVSHTQHRPSAPSYNPTTDELRPLPQWARTSNNNAIPENVPFLDPFAAPMPVDSSANIIPPFSAPITAIAETLSPPVSAPMMPSTSAPGDFEGTSSDSLVTEGEMRGEPRSRRTDDDDASTTSSARAARNSAAVAAPGTGRSSNLSSPSKTSSNGSSDTKRRKGEEKRHTVQLEYISPPAESTRSKTKARESLNGSQMQFASPLLPKVGMSSSATAPLLPSFIDSPEMAPTEQYRHLPLIEAEAAADALGDVHMKSSDTSPRRSMQAASSTEEMTAPSTPPQQTAQSPAADPTVSSNAQPNEASLHPEPAHRKTPPKSIPPTSPSRNADRIDRTPRKSQAPQAEMVDTQRTPRASTAQAQFAQKPTVPFPSPKLEMAPPKPRPVTMAIAPTAIERNGSTRSNQSARPSTSTQSSSRSSQRHRKGLSTDKAFFSRLLGSSTTSIDKTGATGEGSRSRTSSQIDERPDMETQVSAQPLSNVKEDLTHDKKRGAGRRKALSLVVDPFGRSNNGPASANARNRRSTKISSATVIHESEDAPKAGSAFTQPMSSRTSNIPMSPSMPMSPSLQAVYQPLRQVPASGNDAPPSPFSTRTHDTSKSTKRMSDWFKWKGNNRNSTATQTEIVAPDAPKADADKSGMTRSASTRQKRQSIRQPMVVVTDATPHSSTEQRYKQQQEGPLSPRTVATPADARNLTGDQPPLISSQRLLRNRRAAGEAAHAAPFDDSRLKVHSGATDKRIVTKTSPDEILADVRRVLQGMGIQVQASPEAAFRITCTRQSKKQVAAMVNSPASTALTPSPGSTFRSFFSRKNSAHAAVSSSMVASPSMPSPSLTSSSTMEGPESSGLSPTISSQSQMQMQIPYYGATHDGGGEVRFTVEVVRVKNLSGLYTLDFRRLKGALTDYKENHETCIERLKLGSAV